MSSVVPDLGFEPRKGRNTRKKKRVLEKNGRVRTNKKTSVYSVSSVVPELGFEPRKLRNTRKKKRVLEKTPGFAPTKKLPCIPYLPWFLNGIEPSGKLAAILCFLRKSLPHNSFDLGFGEITEIHE